MNAIDPVRIDVHHHFLTPACVDALGAVGIVEAGGPFEQTTYLVSTVPHDLVFVTSGGPLGPKLAP